MEYMDLPGTYQENQIDLLNTIIQIESGTGTSHLCNSPATLVDLSFNDLFCPNPPLIVTKEQMREVVFRNAVMQPITIDPEEVKPPRRRNVRISREPQSIAARLRRERISERMRILQRMVPGGTKMDTASMLEEAIQYVKFLKRQVQELERVTALTDQRASSFFSGGINV